MEELSLLSRASQAVTGSLNLDEVLSEIVLLAGKVAQSDFASVVLVDEEGRVKGKSAETLPGAPALEYRLRGEGFTHWIIRTLRPAVVDALDEDGVIRSALEEGAPKTANPLLLKYGIKSFVGLPLIAKGRLLGVLYLHSLHAYAFGDRLPILIAFGNQAAVAIENARLYDEVQKELDRRKEAEGKLSESNRGLREALRELEQSQDMLQLIIESIPVRVFWKDEDLRYLGCNALFARDAGFSHPQELLGKDDFAMGWRDQAEIYRADDRIVIESRQPKLHIVEPQTTPLGATIWLSTSKVPLVKPDGKILGILGVYEDITLRRQDEEKLKASLRERDVMLREIHHRVKNNIQIISSLLRLQSRRIRDKQALEALGESQNRIKSMALIHEKLYQSQDFTRIDFADYISKMIIHLFAIYKVDAGRIRYRVEAENINLDINGAIPCGLIINELVTNALKHAFPEEREGELIIRMRRDGEDRYTLTVKDSGIGLPKGFDFDRKDTLGFQIVNDLVNQLDGTIEVSCVGGTEIVVRF
jgi:PAS domain S-box-containing protein